LPDSNATTQTGDVTNVYNYGGGYRTLPGWGGWATGTGPWQGYVPPPGGGLTPRPGDGTGTDDGTTSEGGTTTDQDTSTAPPNKGTRPLTDEELMAVGTDTIGDRLIWNPFVNFVNEAFAGGADALRIPGGTEWYNWVKQNKLPTWEEWFK
jgi:hypothetical protein